MNAAKLIAKAQKYDREHREPSCNWSQVPDTQVLRLLIGAGFIKSSEEENGVPIH
jgi:hypothetical protein